MNWRRGVESKLKAIQQMFEEARIEVEKALIDAERANIGSVIPGLYAELGRIYRELAQSSYQAEDQEKGFRYYRLAEAQLRSALDREGWGVVESADTLHDLAEVLFSLGDKTAAHTCLEKIVEIIGPQYQILPGQRIFETGLHYEYFAPLGKVELLKGREAFEQQAWVEGIKHDILAFAYFVHFSPEAVESDNMLEPLYNHLQDVAVDHQREILEQIREWSSVTDFGVDVSGFVEDIASLLGV